MVPKMRMVLRKATPADAKLIALPEVKVQLVKSRPSTVGRQLWKTIAPVMFPIASVSFPVRTHSTLLNFSGSSVAIGAMISDRIVGSRPTTSDIRWTAPTKTCAPRMISASATSTWLTMIRIRGSSRDVSQSAGSRGRMSMSMVFRSATPGSRIAWSWASWSGSVSSSGASAKWRRT
jgi:hypothetical protein